MSKTEKTTFSFNRQGSGESRLPDSARKEIAKEEVHRYNINLPLSLFAQLRKLSYEQDKPINALIVDALNQVYK